MQKSKKLGVIVPYRNRQEHLDTFKKRISRYLKNEGIPYELIIVHQDDGKLFNRGMLLNIGFKYAKELKCDYVVFHDVDMIPSLVDYSYSDVPIHLATELIDRKTREFSDDIFDEYFGGVTLFSIDDFEKIDGYSNKYWGWGYEDDDLLYRCVKKGVTLDTLKLKNHNRSGVKLKLNGKDAYVKGKNFNNLFDFNSNLTLFISFYPDKLELNHEKDVDEFTIFCLPGYNTTINYSSFSRYSFCTFEENNKVIHVNSKIKKNYKTTMCITFDQSKKEIEIYQDGELISKEYYEEKIRDYKLEQIFYLGCTINDGKQMTNFFKGWFDQFAVFSKKLNKEEILEISTTDNLTLTKNGDHYQSSNRLKLYYDSNFIKEYKLVDLSGNANDGEIVNCEIIDGDFDEYVNVSIPFRRDCTFMTLPHKPNGFFNNKWRKKETRWNQLRFHNEVTTNDDLLNNDGLSTLLYVVHNKEYKNNILYVNVGI